MVIENTKEVLIELNDNFKTQIDFVTKFLVRKNFKLIEKHYSSEKDQGKTATVHNQLWKKI